MARKPLLVIATSNPGKLEEFRTLLSELFDLRSSGELGIASPEETGRTFAENADLKALATSVHSGSMSVADDSGLEVDVLGGVPGIRSARYAGEPADPEANIAKLLATISHVPPASRSARFRCAMSLASGPSILARAEGVCEGSIGFSPRGDHGFGYDPIFVLPDGRTMAELEPIEKNAISHRAVAMQRLLPEIAALLAGKT